MEREQAATDAAWKIQQEVRRQEEERQAKEAKERSEAFEREQEEMAKKQAAEDKTRLKNEYIMAEGDRAFFERFYEIDLPKVITERLAARDRRIALQAVTTKQPPSRWSRRCLGSTRSSPRPKSWLCIWIATSQRSC